MVGEKDVFSKKIVVEGKKINTLWIDGNLYKRVNRVEKSESTQVIVWHQWPEEKPTESKWYLVEEVDHVDATTQHRSLDDRLGMEWYISNSQRWLQKELRVVRWADVANGQEK